MDRSRRIQVFSAILDIQFIQQIEQPHRLWTVGYPGLAISASRYRCCLCHLRP